MCHSRILDKIWTLKGHCKVLEKKFKLRTLFVARKVAGSTKYKQSYPVIVKKKEYHQLIIWVWFSSLKLPTAPLNRYRFKFLTNLELLDFSNKHDGIFSICLKLIMQHFKTKFLNIFCKCL